MVWETDAAMTVCLGCGERRGLAVCSERCRLREWRARRRAGRRFIYTVCNEAFVPERSDGRYCSSSNEEENCRTFGVQMGALHNPSPLGDWDVRRIGGITSAKAIRSGRMLEKCGSGFWKDCCR